MIVSNAAMRRYLSWMRSRDLLKQRTPIDDAPGIDAGKFEAFPDHGGNGVIDWNADLALQFRNRWCGPQIGADDRDRIRPVLRHLARSEEHTSELQSRLHLVCRLLL